MNWKKALEFGVLIWIIMFVVISALVGYGIVPSGGGSTAMTVLVTFIVLIITYVAARYVAPQSYNIALQYGLVFAVVGIILDFIISKQFVPNMFSSVSYWVSYLLMVFVPMLAVKKVLPGNTQV